MFITPLLNHYLKEFKIRLIGRIFFVPFIKKKGQATKADSPHTGTVWGKK